ncbi:bifunctional 2',3'-cyclic-nucleotide 2'-phosphodiesterase/3'-nucleotidase [Lacibacterium aquatile]|uniref:Bifunctional 2',3'-cyclic-nucleotide 2'-phosphodiesterase/3'-nucleotidase n=1 Tax=Lacibacterium aquatile TaxID=1168082 RepID=A0ABW5DKS8_9PROT
MRRSSLVLALLAGSLLAGVANAQTAKLRIMETSDLHTNLVNYDYYKDAEAHDFGFSKTATVIRQTRAEVQNSLLIDCGDLLQGTPLADYVAKVKGLKEGEVHPMYAAMNALGYDVASFGNHEFNYGLPFIENAVKGAKFPYSAANIFKGSTQEHWSRPYVMLERTFKDDTGADQKMKIAVISAVPPQIMQWDKGHLEGKLNTTDIIDAVEKMVPVVRQAGADLVIVAAHTGIGIPDTKKGDMAENVGYALTLLPGIDVVLTGHQHLSFPGGFKDLPNTDATRGLVNGKPVSMPGFWGSHLGVIDIQLAKKDGKWTVADAASTLRPISKRDENRKIVPLVENDAEVMAMAKQIHEETLKYIRAPFGKIEAPIFSYFSLVQDDPSVQIVSDAQIWYAKKALKGTKYESLPILSAAAPFKAGGRGGANYYTDVAAGEIAIKNANDLYLYPNTLQIVTMNGAGVREWLEMSVGIFNKIDATKTEPQNVIDNGFPSFNFDVIDGVTYEVDLTQARRYDNDGKLVAADARRIKNLSFGGKPIDDKQEFVVVTNNYRASGGGKFPGVDGKNVILQSPDENRQVLIDYISEKKTVNPSADKNWSFAKVGKPVTIVFDSSATAEKYLGNIKGSSKIGDGENGFVRYGLKLD